MTARDVALLKTEPVDGNAGSSMKIFEANKDKLSDPNKIQVGQVLKIIL